MSTQINGALYFLYSFEVEGLPYCCVSSLGHEKQVSVINGKQPVTRLPVLEMKKVNKALDFIQFQK